MLQRLLDDLVDMPAVVMGRRMDILAWNTAAVALFGDYAELDRAERNIARITFLDETSRELYADWASCARENVAYLHLAAGRHPEDPQLASLIGEPSTRCRTRPPVPSDSTIRWSAIWNSPTKPCAQRTTRIKP
ncbi:hypothetical protein EES41_00430 [Streptomyces sp. ADI95-16]|nr:hypothetical protein EES41_00430 [Streptomyces sp. ADI95-16]